MKSVPSNSVDQALDHVRAGGQLMVCTALRTTVVNARTLKSFEKAGEWLLKADGNGYRLRNGKGSVYLFPGQLVFA